MAATNAPKRYPALDGILVREARLCGDSAELCTCERAALGKKSFAELPNYILSGDNPKLANTTLLSVLAGKKKLVCDLRQTRKRTIVRFLLF